MFPLLLIVIGILVLALGKRLAVLGGAIGALLGVVLLSLLSPSGGLLILLLVGGLAIAGFVAGFAKGIVNIVLLVMGALAAPRSCWRSLVSSTSHPVCFVRVLAV